MIRTIALGTLVSAACGRLNFDPGDRELLDLGEFACDSAPISGPVIYVDAINGSDGNDGSDEADPVATFDRAIALLPGGGTIAAAPGTYGGHISLEKDAPPLRLISRVRYRAIVGGVVCANCSGLVVEGFEIAVVEPDRSGIAVSSGSRLVFFDNIIHDATLAGVRLADQNLATRIDSVSLINNVIYDSASTAIHLNGANRVTIAGNVVFDSKLHPPDSGMVWLERATATTLRGNVVFGAQRDDMDHGYVAVDQTSGVIVENNLLAGSANANSKFRGAFAFHKPSAGAAPVIHYNTLVGAYPGTAHGITATTEVTTEFALTDNMFATTGSPGSKFTDNPDKGNVTLDHNLYAARPANPGDPPTIDDDAHAIVADPILPTMPATGLPPVWQGSQFADGSTTVCELRARLIDRLAAIPTNSPAVGIGNDPAPSFDIRGRPRPVRPALGAFEP